MIDSSSKVIGIIALAVCMFFFMKYVRECRMYQSRLEYLYHKRSKTIAEKEELIHLVNDLRVK